jgi:hypothetical protein
VSDESVSVEDTSDTGVWEKAFWILFLTSTIVMLSYEYLWSRFTLHNLGTISIGTWFWTSGAITTPWSLCLICLNELRGAAKHEKIDRDVCLQISVWAEMIMLAAYLFLVPAVHRLPSLGALQ